MFTDWHAAISLSISGGMPPCDADQRLELLGQLAATCQRPLTEADLAELSRSGAMTASRVCASQDERSAFFRQLVRHVEQQLAADEGIGTPTVFSVAG